MQLFSADTTISKKKKKISPENMKKPPTKVAYNRPPFFSVLPTDPKSAQISYFFHKNGSLNGV
jgi:hypothetical protein